MSLNTYIIEAEGDEGLFEIEVVYEYDPGSPGSYNEPPEADSASIISINLVKHGLDFVEFMKKLERTLEEYERDGACRYNPDDDQ